MSGVIVVSFVQNSLTFDRTGLTSKLRFSVRVSALRSTVQRPISIISLVCPGGGGPSQQVDSKSTTKTTSSDRAIFFSFKAASLLRRSGFNLFSYPSLDSQQGQRVRQLYVMAAQIHRFIGFTETAPRISANYWTGYPPGLKERRADHWRESCLRSRLRRYIYMPLLSASR